MYVRVTQRCVCVCAQEKLAQISRDVQMLLALLTASLCSSAAVCAAREHLHASQEASVHLSCMSDTVQLISDSTGTAADVYAALRLLQSTILDVGIRAARELHRSSSDLHKTLAQDVGGKAFAVDQLLLSMQEIECEVRKLKEQPAQQVWSEGRENIDTLTSVRLCPAYC